MASPNLSEMATVAIDSRTRKLADNVTDNNMLLSRLAMKREARGGRRRTDDP